MGLSLIPKYTFSVNTLVILTTVLVSRVDNEVILTQEEKKYVFIADEIHAEIVPIVKDCSKTLQESFQTGELKNPEYEKQTFWNEILMKKLKPYHDSIREIDQIILKNRPATVLDKAVNISTVEDAHKLSEDVHQNPNMDWIQFVKDGWIKVASMMLQLHHKYNLVFDHLFVEGLSDHVYDDIGFNLNDTLQKYFTWYKIDTRDEAIDPATSTTNELTESSKNVTTGKEGPEKNLFKGLRVLLRSENKKTNHSSGNVTVNITKIPPCSSNNETMTGIRGKIQRYIPVYVLLHLLNAELKYYLMRSVAYMYHCVHYLQCDPDPTQALEQHLDTYYNHYFSGIVEAFKEKVKEAPLPSTVPKEAWRWRCDPPPDNTSQSVPPLRMHEEGVTFARFYDFQTYFLAEEKELSLTKTCRESCDMFDGAFSSIPCEEDDWECLEQEKDFDCLDLTKQGLPCPGKERALCPNGIKCTTGKIQTAQICEGQTNRRHIEWFDINGKPMGKKTSCSQNDMKTLTSKVIVERSGITKYEPQNCEVCLCSCSEPLGNNTHRYISLLPQIADIKNNRSLIGVKLVKIGNVIYIKIAEAQIVFGTPDPSTINWIEPTLVTNFSDPSQVFRLGRNSKNILLDDFLAPTGYAITGLRFTTVNVPVKGDYEIDGSQNEHVIFPVFVDPDVNHDWAFGAYDTELGLEVQLTALNEYGQPKLNASKWKSNMSNTSLARTQVNLGDPDQPTSSSEPSLPRSSTNTYVSVRPSSMKKDAGQSPLPFFDTQEVIESNNISLIRGLGLFHKGMTDFGGFLAFRTISMPISDKPLNPKYDLWHTLRDKN